MLAKANRTFLSLIGPVFSKRQPSAVRKQTNRRRVKAQHKDAPWLFGFQCNERYLEWDRSAQRQLLKLVVAEKLNLTVEQMDSRLIELTAILPDLAEGLGTMKADILVQLIEDPTEIAVRVLYLKTTLPNLDLSVAIRRYPELLASFTRQQLEHYVSNLISELDGNIEEVGVLLSKEPRCLTVHIPEAIAEVTRLMPKESNPLQRFLNDPCKFLSMEQLGMLSTN